jgi:RHS repeat-associated protein
MRFSTKYAETDALSGGMDLGVYYYGERFLGEGRWLNRDPEGEAGGLNLYGAMNNDLINRMDAYGLQLFDPNSANAFAQSNANDISINGTINFSLDPISNPATSSTISISVQLVQTGEIRLDYVALSQAMQANGFSADEANAARNALKKEFFEQQTTIGQAITTAINQARQAAGYNGGTNNPYITNAKINAEARVFKYGGNALASVAFGVQIYNVATAPSGQQGQAAAGAAGSIQGGIVGGEAGGAAGLATLGPEGAVPAAVAGSIIGSILGEGAVKELCAPFVSDASPDLNDQSPVQ